MKDLMFATVAMQERYNKRIEGAVEALEEIRRERMKPTNDVIREIFLAHGFKIPSELTDMRPYVYEAARALLRHYGVWINDVTSRKIVQLESYAGAHCPDSCFVCKWHNKCLDEAEVRE